MISLEPRVIPGGITRTGSKAASLHPQSDLEDILDRAATEKKSFTEWLTVGEDGFQLSDIEDSHNPDTPTTSHSQGEYDPTGQGNQPNPPPHNTYDADIRTLTGHIAQGYVKVMAALHAVLGYRPNGHGDQQAKDNRAGTQPRSEK